MTKDPKIMEFEAAQLKAHKTGDDSEWERITKQYRAYLKTIRPDVDTSIKYIGPKDGAYGTAIYHPHINSWTVFRYKTEAARSAKSSNYGPNAKHVFLHGGITEELSIGRVSEMTTSQATAVIERSDIIPLHRSSDVVRVEAQVRFRGSCYWASGVRSLDFGVTVTSITLCGGRTQIRRHSRPYIAVRAAIKDHFRQ